ncbi:hypothetical protein BJF83_12955 [Nocardiopsis sp. CNR-923]|uniref:hypothetical protein n=1 Tax=Nocardiopsis sp. CNR-923 TaxID=1904965 RepID=UPI000969638C|nr:hypothetical protein [Nocardiopsis sp. CNR-923]OLT29018.1 hypothetical protein BJF83_12955 [Nocardiopsis sp. CNR-923]
MNTLVTSASVLADQIELDRNLVTPGVLGFLTVFAIGVALYFLMRNMTGKLRGLSTETAETAEPAETGDGPAAASVDGVRDGRD